MDGMGKNLKSLREKINNKTFKLTFGDHIKEYFN